MNSLNITEDTKFSTTPKTLYFLGFAVFLTASFVTLMNYRVNDLEAKAATQAQAVNDINTDRLKKRDDIMNSLSEIKVEIGELKTEIRLMRHEHE